MPEKTGAYASPRAAKSIDGLGAEGFEKSYPEVATVGVPVYFFAAAKLGTVGIVGVVGGFGTTGVVGVVGGFGVNAVGVEDPPVPPVEVPKDAMPCPAVEDVVGIAVGISSK